MSFKFKYPLVPKHCSKLLFQPVLTSFCSCSWQKKVKKVEVLKFIQGCIGKRKRFKYNCMTVSSCKFLFKLKKIIITRFWSPCVAFIYKKFPWFEHIWPISCKSICGLRSLTESERRKGQVVVCECNFSFQLTNCAGNVR